MKNNVQKIKKEEEARFLVGEIHLYVFFISSIVIEEIYRNVTYYS